MQNHEREHIRRNLPNLMLTTEVNDGLLAIMQGRGILSQIDCQALQARRANQGAMSQATYFYEMVQNRQGAYNELIEALDSPLLNQNGVAQILRQLRDEAQNRQQPLVVTTHSISHERTNFTLHGNNASPPPIPSCFSSTHERQSGLPSSVGTATATQTFVDIEEEYRQYVRCNVILSVAMKRPTRDMHLANENRDFYKLPFADKGLACIINIHSFDPIGKDDNNRYGSKNDVIYLQALLSGLGFQLFRNDRIDRNNGRWSKQELLQVVQDFKNSCRQRKPRSIVFFIGSHGTHNGIYTSDINEYNTYNKIRLYEDIVRYFYHDYCPELNGRPKIFLVSSCQYLKPEVQHDTSPSCLDVGVSDLILCTAQVPGFAAYRNPNYGTWLIHCLTFVMMKYAQEKSLQEMLTLVSHLLENMKKEDFPDLVHGQIPEIRNIGMKELFFNLPYQ